jgi:hypothetical protein
MTVAGAEIKNDKYQVTTRNTCTLDAKLLKSATIGKLKKRQDNRRSIVSS